jgi:pyruvate-formate lyase-activating enzyme
MCKGYNYEAVTNENNIIGGAIELIKENITPAHDTVVFLGGEPTIHGDKLIEALQYCKGRNLKTKIFTNGTCSNLVEKINGKNLCDSWSVDLKCTSSTVDSIGDYDSAIYMNSLFNTVMNIMGNGLPLEIRTTLHIDNIRDKDSLIRVGNDLINGYKKSNPGVYSKYIVQKDARKDRIINNN